MEPRLFSLDFQVFLDFVLMIIALIPLLGVPLVVFFIIRFSKKEKSDCDKCPYTSTDIKER